MSRPIGSGTRSINWFPQDYALVPHPDAHSHPRLTHQQVASQRLLRHWRSLPLNGVGGRGGGGAVIAMLLRVCACMCVCVCEGEGEGVCVPRPLLRIMLKLRGPTLLRSLLSLQPISSLFQRLAGGPPKGL